VYFIFLIDSGAPKRRGARGKLPLFPCLDGPANGVVKGKLSVFLCAVRWHVGDLARGHALVAGVTPVPTGKQARGHRETVSTH